MTKPVDNLVATNIKTGLQEMVDEAKKREEATASHDPAKGRWRVLRERLEATRDLAVIKNLTGGAPSGAVHSGGFRGDR